MLYKFEGTVTLSPEQFRPAMPFLEDGLTQQGALRIATRAVQLYAERHPRPAQVNQKAAAEMLSVSARTVHNLIKAGILRLNKCGMIPIGEIDLALAVIA
jgi:hypothetical protein